MYRVPVCNITICINKVVMIKKKEEKVLAMFRKMWQTQRQWKNSLLTISESVDLEFSNNLFGLDDHLL